MKKIMLSMLLTLCLLFTLLTPAIAAQPAQNNNMVGPTIAELREMFPNMNLGDDGYVTDYALPLTQSMDNFTPVQKIHNAATNCTLVIYADGSYSAYGVEPLSATDGTVGCSGNRVYWNNYALYYSLNFNVYHSTNSNNYSTITQVGLPVPQWLGAPGNPNNGSMTAVKSKIVTASQTSASNCATAYACALVYLNGVPSFTMILWADVANGAISPRGTTGTPDWANYN